MDKEGGICINTYIHIHIHTRNRILLSPKKMKYCQFAAIWRDLEIIILSEVSQRNT